MTGTAGQNGSFLSTFRDNLSVPNLRLLDPSRRDRHFVLKRRYETTFPKFRSIRNERRFHLYCGGNLKSRTGHQCLKLFRMYVHCTGKGLGENNHGNLILHPQRVNLLSCKNELISRLKILIHKPTVTKIILIYKHTHTIKSPVIHKHNRPTCFRDQSSSSGRHH